jgi:hypothetical protein
MAPACGQECPWLRQKQRAVPDICKDDDSACLNSYAA